MLKEIMPSSNEAVKQYIEKEQRDLVKELELFKEQKQEDKLKKIQAIENNRLQRESELKEKEERMMNWEGRMKDEEAKQMHRFEK